MRKALLFILIATFSAVSAIDVSSCQTLGAAGEYVLTQDITSAGANCIVISVGNVNLTCNGFPIKGSTTGGAAAVRITANKAMVENCKLSNTYYPMSLSGGATNATIRNITGENFTRGIYITGVSTPMYDTFDNITMINVTDTTFRGGGIRIDGAAYIKITRFNTTRSGIGFALYGYTSSWFTNYVNISNSWFTGNTYDFSIYLPTNNDYNKVFDNVFNNTGGISWLYDVDGTTVFNLAKNCTSPNVLGGQCRGGNYWNANAGCVDGNGDGICDSGYTVNGSFYDSLPLKWTTGGGGATYPAVTLNSPAIGANLSNSTITLNWTPQNFSANPTCNATRGGNLIFSGTCTNNTACVSANSTLDGLYSWNVTCYQGSENATSSTRSFRLDTTGPAVSLQSPANITYNSTSLNLNYTSIDSGIGASSCWYSLDGGSNASLPGCGNTSISVAEGSHSINIYSNDTLNNIGSATDYFSINLPPLVNYTSNSESNNAFLNRKWAYFEITYNESERANTTLDLNGTFYEMQCNSTVCWYNAAALVDGNYVYNITMNDTGGLANTTQMRNLSIDTAAPSLSIQSPANQTYYNATSVDLNFTVSDAGAGAASCWYTLDSDPSVALPGCSNASLGNLTHGSHTLFIYANDAVSNIGSANVSFRIRLGPDFVYAPNSEQDNAYLSRDWVYVWITYNESSRENTTLDFNGTIYEMRCNVKH
ncbi:Periplasmic copper-binding protein (NosD) [uncultured archaeon]|nr:Periplasmic copper-binding protein (NosD) [uncultured archaeon]